MGFSKQTIEEIASSLYKELGSDFIDNYKDQAVAKQEELNKYEDRSELEIRLDNFRWFFERIALANKLQFMKTYSKYGEEKQISYDCIEVLRASSLTLKELHTKLQLLSYNTDEFLNEEDSKRLDNYIYQIGDRYLRKLESIKEIEN